MSEAIVIDEPLVQASDQGAEAERGSWVQFDYLPGCNVYFRSSVLRATLDTGAFGQLEKHDPGAILDEFAAALGSGVRKIRTSHGLTPLANGGDRPLEKLCLEAVLVAEAYARSQVFGDDRINFAVIDQTTTTGKFRLVWETDASRISRRAATIALRFISEALQKPVGLTEGALTDVNRWPEFQELVQRRTLTDQTAVLRNAARSRALPYEILGPRRLRIGEGVFQHEFVRSLIGSTPLAATRLTLDRHHLNRRLAELTLPVPQLVMASTETEAVAAVEKVGVPALIRRVRSDDPETIVAQQVDPTKITAAFKKLGGGAQSILIEQRLTGREYRLLVVGGELVAAALCSKPVVRGDGESSITELLDALNHEADRDGFDFVPVTAEVVMHRLSARGLGLDWIPPAGTTVCFASTASLAGGASSVDVTDSVHPDNREVAERAAKGTGLLIAGVDFVCPDIARSYRESAGGIVRVSAAPKLGLHIWPREGRPRDVGGAILKLIVPDPGAICIPAAFIVGQRGTNTVARALSQMLSAEGEVVGICTKTESSISGQTLDLSPEQLSRAPRVIARNKTTTRLVSAISPGRILKAGFGLDHVEAALFLASEETVDDQDRSEALRMVARMPHTIIIVGSEDKNALSVLEEIDPARLLQIGPVRTARSTKLRDLGLSGAIVTSFKRKEGTQLSLIAGGREVVGLAASELPKKLRSVPTDVLLKAFALKVALFPAVRSTLKEAFDDS